MHMEVEKSGLIDNNSKFYCLTNLDIIDQLFID